MEIVCDIQIPHNKVLDFCMLVRKIKSTSQPRFIKDDGIGKWVIKEIDMDKINKNLIAQIETFSVDVFVIRKSSRIKFRELISALVDKVKGFL